MKCTPNLCTSFYLGAIAQVDILTAALRATSLDTNVEEAFLEPRQAHDNPFSPCHVPLIDSSDVEVCKHL